ncbi:hypothetical protein [Caulobacter sp. Root655]|uniref:immunity protein TriTu family protein n=1 Tax=Caulobacter sp. Root655 TaxID=1736578 RepID=UPI0012E3E1E4|nr:hypothetical protein [Caulobacter sp. Root655]
MSGAQIIDLWIEVHASEIHEMVEFVVRSDNWSTAPNSGAWVDFESDIAWARITVWPEGQADLEIVDAKTSENVFWRHCDDLRDEIIEEWFSAFKDLFKTVGGVKGSRR